MSRAISKQYLTDIVFSTLGGPQTAFSSIIPETQHLGKLCLLDINKQSQIRKGHKINISRAIVYKFFQHINRSYSEIEQFDKREYRETRRMSILSWLLDDYIDYDGFANPLNVYINDRFDKNNSKPVWSTMPGSTREVIEYMFGAKSTFRGIGFVPKAYKRDDITIVKAFKETQDFLDYIEEINPSYKSNKRTNIKSVVYNTNGFGQSLLTNLTNHKDEDDRIKREYYFNLCREYYLNNNVHFSFGKSKEFKEVEYFNKTKDNADVSIHIKPKDAEDHTIKSLLVLPLMHKHPQLIDILKQDDNITIRKI